MKNVVNAAENIGETLPKLLMKPSIGEYSLTSPVASLTNTVLGLKGQYSDTESPARR